MNNKNVNDTFSAKKATDNFLQKRKLAPKKEKEKENLKRAKRLKDELNRVFGQDISAEKLAKKLDIPLGTARGLLYKGAMPTLHKAEIYAKKLNIDVVYWIMGRRISVEPARLADSMSLVYRVISERPVDTFDLAQTAYMISLVYNSSTTVCESVAGQMLDLIEQSKN